MWGRVVNGCEFEGKYGIQAWRHFREIENIRSVLKSDGLEERVIPAAQSLRRKHDKGGRLTGAEKFARDGSTIEPKQDFERIDRLVRHLESIVKDAARAVANIRDVELRGR